MVQLLACRDEVHWLPLPAAIWVMLTIITSYIFRETVRKPQDYQRMKVRYISNEEHGGAPLFHTKHLSTLPHVTTKGFLHLVFSHPVHAWIH